MKKLGITLLCLLIIGFSRAQDFENKGNYMSVGIGTDLFVSHADDGFAIGPFLINYERGITDMIGIGRFGAGLSAEYSVYTGEYNDKVADGSRLILMGRGTYHFEFNVPKMDVYAGAGLGGHFSDTDYYGRSFELKHRVFAGIRYYFKPNLGVYGEVGIGSSMANGGFVLAF